MTNHLSDLADQSVIGWGNRGWIEIVETILESCRDGSLKTHVMYQCNLNSKQINQYLKFLLNNRLIENISNKRTSTRTIYKTTESGRKYINAFKELKSLFE